MDIIGALIMSIMFALVLQTRTLAHLVEVKTLRTALEPNCNPSVFVVTHTDSIDSSWNICLEKEVVLKVLMFALCFAQMQHFQYAVKILNWIGTPQIHISAVPYHYGL